LLSFKTDMTIASDHSACMIATTSADFVVHAAVTRKRTPLSHSAHHAADFISTSIILSSTQHPVYRL